MTVFRDGNLLGRVACFEFFKELGPPFFQVTRVELKQRDNTILNNEKAAGVSNQITTRTDHNMQLFRRPVIETLQVVQLDKCSCIKTEIQ